MTARECAVPDCATGARLRVCHECECAVCLIHSRVVQALVWSSNGTTTFTAKRYIRTCLGCAAKIEAETAAAPSER